MIHGKRFEDMTMAELRELREEIQRKISLFEAAEAYDEQQEWSNRLNELVEFVNTESNTFNNVTSSVTMDKTSAIQKIKSKLKNAKRSTEAKFTAALTSLIVVTGGLSACANTVQPIRSESKEAIVETQDDSMYYDESIYAENPIASDTILNHAEAWKELYAKYGMLEDGKFSDVHFTFLASQEGLNEMTDGQLDEFSVAGTKDRKGVTLASSQTIIDRNYQTLVTLLMTREFDVDWSNFLSRKFDVKVLNETQSLYLEAVKSNSPEVQQKVRDFIDEWSRESESVSSEAAVYLTAYTTWMRNYDVINDDFYNMAVAYLDGSCKMNLESKCSENNACATLVEGYQELDSNNYQDARRDSYVISGYAIEKSGQDTSRFLNIVDMLAKKNIKNQDYKNGMSAGQYASEQSKEYEMSLRGGATIGAGDVINPDGTIQGSHEVSNHVGDTVQLPDTNLDGTVQTLTDAQVSAIAQLAAIDGSSGSARKSQAELEAMYPGHGAEAKKTYDSVYDQTYTPSVSEGTIHEEEKTEDVIYDTPVTPVAPTTPEIPVAPVAPTMPDPSINPGDIVNEDIQVEDVYFDFNSLNGVDNVNGAKTR